MKKNYFIFLFFIIINTSGQINLTNGLVGYFPLNNSTADLSPLHQNGTGFFVQPSNGVLGQPDSAYFFDGVNSYIDFGTGQRNINHTVTISAWFKTVSNNYEWIVGHYDWHQDSGYHVAIQNGHLFLGGRNGSGNYIRVDSNVNVIDGKWHHVLAEINQTTWSIWVDCQFYNSITSIYNPNITPVNTTLSVGYYPIGDSGLHHYFHGNIDEVRVYNRTLTSAEKDFLCQIETAGSNEIYGLKNIEIYPNPSHRILHIKRETTFPLNMRIYDISGKLILNRKFDNPDYEINVESFEKGIYLIELSHEKEIFKHLFIKN